jgi:hypothetical protein
MMSHAAMASGTLVITTGITSAARPAASRAALTGGPGAGWREQLLDAGYGGGAAGGQVALSGITGAGLGALLGTEVITIAGLLLYLYVAEPLLSRISALGSWTAYLPGVATGGLTQASQAGVRLLPPWQGPGVFRLGRRHRLRRHSHHRSQGHHLRQVTR